MTNQISCLWLAALFSLTPVAARSAEVWSNPVSVTDVRVYPGGGLAVAFTPALPAGCPVNNITITYPSAPSHKLMSALAITALTTQKKVLIIYDGCAGNVNATGLVLVQ